jgi:hypothetical protein
MAKQQKLCKGTNDALFLFIRSRFVEDLRLKGGEKFCMKKGRGKQLIIDFDCEEEEVTNI